MYYIVSTSFPWLTLAICAVYHGNQNNGGDIITGQCKTQTADCGLQTVCKMQTAD